MPTKKPIFEKKNVLITGGAGFIGSHLCDRLVKEDKVICIDNFITGNIDNINHLLQYPNFRFIKQDITEQFDLEQFEELRPFKVAFQGIQEIYNLACPTSPKDYNMYPIETLLANSLGTKNILDLAVKYEAKFIHLSTSAIYGEPLEDKPFPEDYWGFIDPIGPRSCYNEGKRFAESLIVGYRNVHNLEAKIARVFNTYGPRMKLTDGRMIPDFINQALKNEKIIIYGEKEGKATFCYISDIVDGVIKMMSSKELGPINLGSDREYKFFDIASKIKEITESSSNIVFEKPFPYLAKQGVPDIRLAKERLGWFPVVPHEDGLQRTIEYMKGSKAMGIKDIKL